MAEMHRLQMPWKTDQSCSSDQLVRMKCPFPAVMVLAVSLSMAERRGVIRISGNGSTSDASGGVAYRHGLDISEPLLERVIFTLNNSKKGLL
jgi:hypothetical protein